jgi:hypothetical protein
MCDVRWTISAASRKAGECHWQTAQPRGHWRRAQDGLALLAVIEGQSFAPVALVLRVHEQTGAPWIQACCCDGLRGAPRRQPTGRPPTLPPIPTTARAPGREVGPVQAGFRGACWRSPMIQPRMYARLGVDSHGFSSAQVLKHFGCRAQQAAWVSAHLQDQQRPEGRPTTWPPRLRRAQERHALRRGGEEASLPPWGPLTDPWARRGQHPKGQPSGTRTGSTGFGWMDALTGWLL